MRDPRGAPLKRREDASVMPLQITHPPAAPAVFGPANREASIAPAALDNLAARFRPGGLFLVLLRPDGTIAYHDSGAAAFHVRYTLPQLQVNDAGGDPALRDKIRLTNAASGV